MGRTVINSLLNAIEPSKFTLLSDTSIVHDNSLLYSFVCSASKQHDKIHIFLFEHTEAAFVKKANLCDSLHQITFHACDALFSDKENHSVLPSTVLCNKLEADTLIVVDSLSAWLHNFSLATIVWELHALKNISTNTKVIALLHSDCHTAKVVNSVKKMATAFLCIGDEETELSQLRKTSASFLSPARKNILICDVKVTRKNGKAVHSKEEFLVSQDLSISCKSWEPSAASKLVEVEVDPDTQVQQSASFNLMLSKHERQQKDKLVMPYIKAKLPVLSDGDSNTNRHGNIFYEPDDADDYDDEDPDDDLDF